MELKGAHTQANLLVAYSGESQAAEKYVIYAARARRSGYRQIAELLEETAENERQHARIWFDALNKKSDTLADLADAARGEHYEWDEMYPLFAGAAEEEGFAEIAARMRQIAAIEQQHEARFLALHENIRSGQVFRKPEKTVWICRKCGFTIESENAPQVCPVCSHGQEYFEVRAHNW